MSDNNEIKSPKRGKTEGYSNAKMHAKRNRKRIEAEQRQDEHDSLTIQEKIAKALKRPGSSKREVARLMALVPQPQVVPVTSVKEPPKAKKTAKRKTAAKAV